MEKASSRPQTVLAGSESYSGTKIPSSQGGAGSSPASGTSALCYHSAFFCAVLAGPMPGKDRGNAAFDLALPGHAALLRRCRPPLDLIFRFVEQGIHAPEHAFER